MSQVEQSKILLETGTNEVEFLEFSIGNNNFAVNVAKIRQTVVYKDLVFTKLPQSKFAMPGVVQYRGSSVPVIDLRDFLSIEGSASDPDRQLLLLMEFNRRVNGYKVDAVTGIHRVSWRDFEPLDISAWGRGKCSAIGTITIQGRVIMILDMEALTAELDPSMAIEQYKGETEPEIKSKLQALQIIYAEDSPIVQKIAVKALIEAGFANIKTFMTGLKALEYIKANPLVETNLILSDIEMPEMDGLTLCKTLKQDPKTAGIPFIFFSSIVTEEMKRKCDAVGGNGSYSKPELTSVIDAIKEIAG